VLARHEVDQKRSLELLRGELRDDVRPDHRREIRAERFRPYAALRLRPVEHAQVLLEVEQRAPQLAVLLARLDVVRPRERLPPSVVR